MAGSRRGRLRKKLRGGNGRSMPKTKYATSAASLPPSAGSSATCWDSCESRMAPGSNTIGTDYATITSTFSPSGTSFCVNETNCNGDWTAQGRTSPACTNVACRNCSPTAQEERGSRPECNAGSSGADLEEHTGV